MLYSHYEQKMNLVHKLELRYIVLGLFVFGEKQKITDGKEHYAKKEVQY